MAYNLYIDNVNARAAYGVVLADGAHRQLFEPPAFKTPDCTEWPEYDGAEYDLEAPVLAGRTLSLPLHVLDASKTPDLVAALTDGAYHEFMFEFGVPYNYTFAWRLVSVSSYRSLGRLATLTLSLAEDEWVMWYKDFPAYPGDTPFIRTQGYALDGLDFSRWGLCVLDGTAESLAKPPAVRPALSVDVASEAGVQYDTDAPVRFKARDVTLHLFMRADDTLLMFMILWGCFLVALTQPGERTLAIAATGEELKCFYKKCSVKEFEVTRGGKSVWFKVDVTMTVID